MNMLVPLLALSEGTIAGLIAVGALLFVLMLLAIYISRYYVKVGLTKRS